jgi:acyl carrier protein
MDQNTATAYSVSINEILDVIAVSAGNEIGTDVSLLDSDQNLFDSGLTSIGFITMIVEFEKRYNIVFDEHELDLANFNTPRAIHFRIKGKMCDADWTPLQSARE